MLWLRNTSYIETSNPEAAAWKLLEKNWEHLITTLKLYLITAVRNSDKIAIGIQKQRMITREKHFRELFQFSDLRTCIKISLNTVLSILGVNHNFPPLGLIKLHTVSLHIYKALQITSFSLFLHDLIMQLYNIIRYCFLLLFFQDTSILP